jgi:iron complex outermembrane receptor protein
MQRTLREGEVMIRDLIAGKRDLLALLAGHPLRGVLLCTALTAVPAFSQQAAVSSGTAQLEEIEVTAQRRSERLQNVPIAVTAITAEQAAAQGITGTLALTAVTPSLQINQTSNFAAIYLRGVGSNLADPTAEPSVATYVDGVYISSPQATFFSFNNIERIEVLKGPQGTLFGRNATGGVIQLVTRDPSERPSADISVGYGNYNTISSSFYGTAGVMHDLAADLAVVYEDESAGYGRNYTLNKDIFKYNSLALRSKWLWTPVDGTEFRFTGDYGRFFENNAGEFSPGIVARTYPTGNALYAGPHNTLGNIEQMVINKNIGGAVRWDQDLGGLKLFSITSYRKSLPPFQFNLDSDIGPATLGGSFYTSFSRDWTQEFQLSNKSSGTWDWAVGLFYFDVVGGYDPWHSIGGGFFWKAQQSTRSWAGYGQATRHFDSGTSITAGIRYTRDEQSMSSVNLGNALTAFSDSKSASKPTWRLSLDQKFSDSVLGYVSYNRGFKSGGYNLLDVAHLNRPPPQTAPTYNPEVLDAYEVGLKSDLLERRLRLNVAAFYYNYKDIQLQQPVLTGGFGNRIQNAAAAKIKGLEGEFEAVVTEHLTLNGDLSVLDSKYEDFYPAPGTSSLGVNSIIDASGKQLIGSPKYSGSLGAEYSAEIAGVPVTASVKAVYNNGFYWAPDNRLRQPSYTLLNSTIVTHWADDKYEVRLWGKNLGGAKYFLSTGTLSGAGDNETQAPPRTYGVTFVGHFK